MKNERICSCGKWFWAWNSGRIKCRQCDPRPKPDKDELRIVVGFTNIRTYWECVGEKPPLTDERRCL